MRIDPKMFVCTQRKQEPLMLVHVYGAHGGDKHTARARSFALIVNTVAAPRSLDALLPVRRRDDTLTTVGAQASPHPVPEISTRSSIASSWRAR